MRWEKRMTVAEALHVMDSNPSATMPLCLHFDPTKLAFQYCDITSLALTWHQVDGMRTSLTTGSPCLCVHVDRCFQKSDGTISKIQTALQCDEECFMPVLAKDGQSSIFIGYTIVAVMAHIGSDGSGHYRAGLKLRPAVTNIIHRCNGCSLMTGGSRKPYGSFQNGSCPTSQWHGWSERTCSACHSRSTSHRWIRWTINL